MNSTKNTKLRIGLIGPYPPPYGGISIHIQRLKEQLEKRGYECVVYELGRQEKLLGKNIIVIKNPKRWLLKYFFLGREDIIHYHSPDWRMRVIMGLMGLLGKKTVISIHGESLEDSLKEGRWLRRQIIKFAIKHASFIIALNSKIKELALSLGVKPERVEVIPSFIPPTIKEKELDEIPQEIWHFIDSHNPVISANAFRIVFYNDQDLYGIDMCIDLCGNLKSAYPQLGFVFCLPDVGDYDYFCRMKQRVIEKGIENNFLFITESYQFYPMLMKSHIFVRPTCVDGYGISIAEAIHFKIPAVASDVCSRPEGTILFKSRAINDFTSKVKDVLENYNLHKKKLETANLENNFKKIVKVYQKLASHDQS